ncbi:hypothetical protein PHYSODRAFT_501298 [Phytophthora sojae]|uniref:Endonuclease/exonuclease/phosphatase domain-containing protein n=1 Tax=Phytophthora sojae (strain P6497) TaxID=1094619 RepID=G4ZCI1_PHYSP|nr:hypothetical protein PHYSODRAFT_501298 [Phytophthora sojae]EGZ16870.1 hypothetical protein PHYSODRAFT_501298 [Phytophthora sojae]|eukprot:XP_009525928.1 hypothetical protein PHYSODRAFT_501298 [Phytophthora sojae]
MVQDARLHTAEQVRAVKQRWNRTWARKAPEHPLSYWTTTETKSAGLGILCTPHVSSKVRPWQRESWTNRVMAVEFDGWLLVNIYAPIDQAERLEFFSDLDPWLRHHESIILGGDFNCVLNRQQDRVTGRKPSTASCESPYLQEMLQGLELTDAVSLKYQLDEEDVDHDPLHHYSFWRKDGASRLDRFYVKGQPYAAVQWVEALPPAHNSDHYEVRLEHSLGHRRHQRSHRPIQHPIVSGRPERVREALGQGLHKLLDAFDNGGNPVGQWDKLVADIQNLIRDTSRQDRKQTQRYFENLRAATRKPTASRAEHQKDLDATARLRAARSFGDSIQQSPETAR